MTEPLTCEQREALHELAAALEFVDLHYFDPAHPAVVLAAEIRRREGTCEWSLTPDNVDDDYWATACGKQYLFFEGGPKDNGFVCCPFCAQFMVEVRPEPEPEVEESDADDPR